MGVSIQDMKDKHSRNCFEIIVFRSAGDEELFFSCFWLFPNLEFIFDGVDWQRLEHFYTLQWISLQA